MQHRHALRGYVQIVWPNFNWDRVYTSFLDEFSAHCGPDELEPTRTIPREPAVLSTDDPTQLASHRRGEPQPERHRRGEPQSARSLPQSDGHTTRPHTERGSAQFKVASEATFGAAERPYFGLVQGYNVSFDVS
jgi:hypothetical protein